MVKFIFVFFGSVFILLGIIGIFLPLLPTTPFLLLAAACYVRGSEKFYNWLISHKRLGEYIKNYREGRGISKNAKVYAIITLWLSIGYSTFYVVNTTFLKILLLFIAVGVTKHLLSLNTLQNNAHELDKKKLI